MLSDSLKKRVEKAFAWATLAAAVLLPSIARAQDRHADRPNVLFLLADDQRADTIAAWGNKHIKTPNIDSIVQRGFSFRNHYCFGSNSGAVCLPSRAMLMSGKTWLQIKNDLSGVETLPERLSKSGYAVFATGKWHNGEASFVRSFPEARSVFFGGMADHRKVPIADVHDGKVVNRRVAEKFSSVEFADAAVEYLESRQTDDPFFCYVAFTAPHDPRDPPASFKRMYYDNRPPLPDNYAPEPKFDNGLTVNVRDENLAPYPRTKEVISDQLCEYYGMITHLDEQVGRILATLEKTGRTRNTIVIYSADHGLAIGSHGLLGKQSLYEHSMKAPLVIAGPGIPAGRSTEAFTYHFDLFPTICDFASVSPPESLAGFSLKPILTGEQTRIRDSIFLPYENLMRSIRDDRWKLIVYPPINYRELFDLKNDPGETRNLADEPRNAEHVERLIALMKSWRERTGDRQPLDVDNPKSKDVSFKGFERKPDPWQPDWIIKKYFQMKGTESSSNPN